jgi:hypothetical protein
MPEITKNKHVALLLGTYLREYDTLRNEYLKRVEMSSQIQLYTIVAFGGLIALIQYVESSSSRGNDPNILYLFAAIVFCALGWYQFDLDDRVADIDNYILQVLSLKIAALITDVSTQNMEATKADKVLEWQIYWRKERYRTMRGAWLRFGVVGKTGIATLSAFGLLFYYVYASHITSNVQWSLINVTLTLLVTFGAIWILVASIIISKKFKSVTTALLRKKAIDIQQVSKRKKTMNRGKAG